MKYLLPFIAIIVVFLSCDNELELLTDYKETPVVYGVLDQTDTAQYIRVERVFVDPNIPGPELAKNPDSLYYDDITVKIIRVKNGNEYTLTRVDGNLEGYPREDGTFATAPNYLYKILTTDIPLIEEEVYQISVEGVYDDRAITGEATIIDPPFFVYPTEGSILSFDPFFQEFAIGWNVQDDESSAIFSASYYMHITETKDGISTSKRLKWEVEPSTDKTLIERPKGDFFSFLRGALDRDPAITRTFDELQFELISGGENISQYIKVGQANLGITSSGEIPSITNLSEGLGLFGAKVTDLRKKLKLTSASKDSLMNSTLTKELNFQ